MPLTQDMGHIDKPDLEHNIAYQILNPNTNITISKPDTDIDHNSDRSNSSSEIAICTKPLFINLTNQQSKCGYELPCLAF